MARANIFNTSSGSSLCLRWKRLLGQRHAIEAARELANGLVEEEETLTQEFLSALQAKQPSPLPQTHEESAPIRTSLPKEKERLRGIDEPLTEIIPSAQQSRQFLTHLETRLPERRSHLSRSNGWFEVFHVPKRHDKPTCIADAKALEQEQQRKIPLPKSIVRDLHPEVARHLRLGIQPKDMPRDLRDERSDINHTSATGGGSKDIFLPSAEGCSMMIRPIHLSHPAADHCFGRKTLAQTHLRALGY